MMRNARRIVAALLTLCLVATLAPLDAYAAVARVPAGIGRGVPAMSRAIPAALGSRATPLSGAPTLRPVAGLTSLSRSASALAASSSDKPERSEPAAAAPQGEPAVANPTPAPAAQSETVAPAAATPPQTPASSDAAPAKAPARRSLLGLFKSSLGRASSRPQGAEAESTDGRVLFDGGSPAEGSSPAVAAEGEKRAPAPLAKPAERPSTRDAFRGPLSLGRVSRASQARYGLKWGLNMIGIVALYDLLARPALALLPWTSMLGDSALQSFGRVALMTQLGPGELAQLLSASPATFLGLPLLLSVAALAAVAPLSRALTAKGPLAGRARAVKLVGYAAAGGMLATIALSAPALFFMNLPGLVLWEELIYRGLVFLIPFTLLALARPGLARLANVLGHVPNHAGAIAALQGFLRRAGNGISSYAYPLAAGLAAFSFARAHFANWGIDPYVFLVHMTLGLALTRLAYRSEGLIAPFVAHLTFNLATLGTGLLLALRMPGAAVAYPVLISLLGGAVLLYNYLSHRRDLSAVRGKSARPTFKIAVATALAGLVAFGAVNQSTSVSSSVLAQGAPAPAEAPAPPAAEPAAAPAPSAAPAPAPSRADVLDRLKPSVFRVSVVNGMGTGFIVSPRGLAVTNAHVVGSVPPGRTVNFDFANGLSGTARVLAVNHDKDIALLELPLHPEGRPWPAVTLAAAAPRVGEDTLAIGHPLGLALSVTHGIVSARTGEISLSVDYVQTDASINQGNSGGPLFNEWGELIGINTMLLSMTGGSDGLGFAITSQDLAHVLNQYARTRDISSGRLGVVVNLSDPAKPSMGVEIEQVRPGSGAARAGLRPGDIIVGYKGRPLPGNGRTAAAALMRQLARVAPDERVSIVIVRGGGMGQVVVTADAKVSTPQ